MPNFLDMILGVGAGKPQAPQSGFDRLISNPLLMNILAQQGHSLTPGPSPLGVVGRAGLATAQQKQANSRAELQKQFIEAQIGHLNRLPAGGGPQETFRPPTEKEAELNNLDPTKAYRVSELTGKIEQIGSSGTTVNVNNPPPLKPGFENIYDDNNRVVRQNMLPGGPAALEAEAERQKAADRKAGAAAKVNTILDETARITNLIQSGGLPETGFIGSRLAGIEGTEPFQVAEGLKTIKAIVGFQELRDMRESSPTGGALGNVSNLEVEFLQALQGSLAQGQDPEELIYNLNRLSNGLMDVVHGVAQGPERIPNPRPPSFGDTLTRSEKLELEFRRKVAAGEIQSGSE